MAAFLLRPELMCRDFISERIGAEAEEYWAPRPSLTMWARIRTAGFKLVLQHARNLAAQTLVRAIAGRDAAEAFQVGLFRRSGEVHHWLYDRYSLKELLATAGFTNIKVCRADESDISEFGRYGLDCTNGKVRKPDSLFMEARKP